MKAEILNYGYTVPGIETQQDGTTLYRGYSVEELKDLAIKAIIESYEP